LLLAMFPAPHKQSPSNILTISHGNAEDNAEMGTAGDSESRVGLLLHVSV
jgi:hypothetical protein